MTRIPEPHMTENGPAYEGRLLHRADDEVVDQGASFDITTLLSRRGMLSLLGVGVATVALAACTPTAGTGTGTGGAASGSSGTGGATGTSAGEIPDETAGPYPGDGSNGPDVLERSGIVRSDIRSSLDGGATAGGVPLTFTLTVLDMANGNASFAGVAVYAWHCDAEGRYSMYSSGVESETYLRGVQVADAAGQVTFTSIFPGCYAGRWPHIHFEVYPDVDAITDHTKAIATSQLAFPQDASERVYATAEYPGSTRNLSQLSLATDGIFSDDTEGIQNAKLTGSVTAGYVATLDVPVDIRTTPAGGGMGGPGGGNPPSRP